MIFKDIDARREQLMGAMRGYMRDYMKVNKVEGVPLRILSARYGKALTKIGLTLAEAIEADPRFRLTMLVGRGSYMVFPVEVHPVTKIILDTINKAGGEVLSREVLKAVMSNGYPEMDYIMKSAELFDGGVITIDGPTYKLNRL